MTITQYIDQAPTERQAILTNFHAVISTNDLSVVADVKPMMSKNMILYEERCHMKYGLANTKAYLSLHCLPMYMNTALHAKYEALLPSAKFQKGCINFRDETEFPLSTLTSLIEDCATVNIAQQLENRKNKKA